MLYNFFLFILNIIVYIVIIYIFHYLWEYLKNNYSQKKTKDVYNFQKNKYEQIVESIQQGQSQQPTNESLQNEDIEKLNNELESYVNAELASD
jgi:SPX domain protein involved in polyphosphate accumulation|tara:strand:- start:254 stop:532 length:279 start_codon:yes stop_codon:yes gene_type:complete